MPKIIRADDKQNDKKTVIIFLVIILILSVFIAVCGWMLGSYGASKVVSKALSPTTEATSSEESAYSHMTKDSYTSKIDDTQIQMLKTIVTNLDTTDMEPNSKTKWIKADIGLVISKSIKIDSETQGRLVNDFLAYFRSLQLKDVQGPTALLHIKEDLLDRANVITTGHVSNIVISTLVVQ